MLSEGERLPNLTLHDDTGAAVSIRDLNVRGPLVLWFYPKDDTPG